MSALLEPRRWYASRAAAERDGYSIVFTSVDSVGHVWLGFARPDSEDGWPMPWRDVTGRSAAHVDRLARDWIAHGVSPTKTGGRGVAPACTCVVSVGYHSAKASYTWDRRDWPLVEHEEGCVAFAFARAERRALAVVSR